MKNLKVADLMSKNVISFFEEQSLPLARDLMKLKKMRHIPVVNEDMRVVGIITHRDILRVQSQSLELIDGQSTVTAAPDVAVKKVMSKDVWTVNQNASAHDAGKLLIEHAFGCLPVVDDEHKLVGIVTDRDYLRFAITLLKPT
jgi:CBS domain-containing membrane protein